jgi:pogo transposable element with ZNF domain
MDYLRRIVTRMFQNTLSLLSRRIIQQFLDELVWREQYGTSPGQAFDNIVTHISEQTRAEAKEPFTSRLTKVSANPYRQWVQTKANKRK